jgi:hypothetical protein
MPRHHPRQVFTDKQKGHHESCWSGYERLGVKTPTRTFLTILVRENVPVLGNVEEQHKIMMK